MIKLDIGGRPRLPRPGFEVSKRVVVLGLLILLMLIPLSMIGGLVSERYARRLSVEGDIAGQWGYSQSIGGPLLIVPYIVHLKTKRNDGSITEQEQRKLAYFLPDQLAINAAVKSEKRYRSIYEVLVYTAVIEATGRLTPAAFTEWAVAAEDILWNEASIAVGIADTSGIRALSFT
ncbi:MAG: inner membrane CreD family protein, partial [Dongiaceae bacterium]